MGLTPKQEGFCLSIVSGMNQSDAYRANYNYSKMKPATINRNAKFLIENNKVATRIEELRKPIQDKAQIDAAYVLKRLVDIDKMDIAEILNSDGALKPISEWPLVWRTTISGFDLQEMTLAVGDSERTAALVKKIKWPDKTKNLELIGKHVAVQAFSDKLTIVDDRLDKTQVDAIVGAAKQ